MRYHGSKYSYSRLLLLPVLLGCLLSAIGAHAQLIPYRIYSNNQSYAFYPLCNDCYIENAYNAMGSNENDYSLLVSNSPGGAVEQTLIFPIAGPGVFSQLVIGIGANQVISTPNQLAGVTVETFNGGVSNNDLVRAETVAVISEDPSRAVISIRPAKAFDRVKVRLTRLSRLIAPLGHLKLFYGYHYTLPVSACAAFPFNPIAYYPFDGNLRDSTAFAHHGEGQDIQYVSNGICHRAAYFGLGDRSAISIKNSPLPTNAITVAFWIERTLINESSFMLASKGLSISLSGAAVFNTFFYFLVNNGVSSGGVIGDGFASLDRKIHIVCTFNGSTATIYKNGRLISQGVFNGVMQASDSIRISGSNVTLDELVMYDRALDSFAVKYLYTSYNYTGARSEGQALSRSMELSATPKAHQLRFSPNPTSGIIQLSGKDMTGSVVSVSTIDGKEVYRAVAASNSLQLPAILPAGTYLIRVQGRDRQVYMGKILLSR